MKQMSTLLCAVFVAFMQYGLARADEVFLSQAKLAAATSLLNTVSTGSLLATPVSIAAAQSSASAATASKQNLSLIRQTGSNNSAIVSQSGSGNVSSISQQGHGNVAVVTQSSHSH